MKTAVLLINPVLPWIDEALRDRYLVHHYYAQTDKGGFLKEVGSTVRGVVTGGASGIGSDLMRALPALEIVAVNGIGTDAVDLEQARARGIHVSTTPGVLTDDVADLAIGLLISSTRALGTSERYLRTGQWGQRTLPLARRFSGMKIGIVGMGRVGRAIALRASAFGCPISYTDLKPMTDVPYRFVPQLIELARSSDALVLAASADDAEEIVNAEALEALGPNGYLINIARGKLVNEEHLVYALESGIIAGAGLDVFVDEPNVPSALLKIDAAVLQPHRGSATVETRSDMGRIVLDSLADAFAGRRPATSVTT
jgi:hydroxypyruvate reductase